MERTRRRYQSGLVEVGWTARCPRCDRRVVLSHQSLAQRWEAAHVRHGCARELLLDESGRGWIPGPERSATRSAPVPSTPGGHSAR